MKKLLLALCILPVLAAAARADIFSDFKKYAAKTYIKPFAEDLGGLIGSTDFNTGSALGFPGVEVGVDAAIQANPDAGDKILRDAKVTSFAIPMAHADVALPLVGADVMLRGVSYSGFTIIGGGLRYPLLKSGTLTKFIPDVSVSAYYDAITQDYFKGSHMSVDAAASFDIPVIKPYVGVGIDRTNIETKSGTPVASGTSDTSSMPRYTLGVRLSPMPLVYIYGEYNVLHGQTGYTFGAGVKF